MGRPAGFDEWQRVASTAMHYYYYAYPLHPPGQPEKLRDAHLKSIEVPVLWLQRNPRPLHHEIADGIMRSRQ
jgi:predicted alpha/beta-hydrolase family hydrolase